MKKPSAALVVIVCAGLSGCATAIHGTSQNIPILSDPTGAKITVDGNVIGTTPTEVKLSRKTDHLVVVEKDGYETERVPIANHPGAAGGGVAPGAGYAWIDGYWGYNGGRYAWVAGRWDRPPRARARWEPGRWETRRAKYYYRAGRWR